MRKLSHIITALSALLPVLAGCGKDTYADMGGGMQEVRFEALDPELSIVTKVGVWDVSVLNSNGFYVSSTKGTAGSETSVWTSASFGKSGQYFVGGKYWPSTNQNQHFYASNNALTFAAAGTTVTATNTKDVICAYLPDPAYKQPNTLQFKHIFARIGDVTVTAGGGYTLSNVHVQVTPNTGGTYNLRTGDGQTDGTGWSSLTTGSATELANTTAGTKSNDVYLVPGTYDVSLSWTATKGGYTADLSKTVKDVAITGGSVNALSVILKGSAADIELSVSITGWDDLPVDMGLIKPVPPPLPSFAGYNIAPGLLYYDGSGLKIADSWDYSSYGTTYGLNAGSTYLSFIEVGTLMDSRGSSFTASSGDIDNTNLVSYYGHDDWRLITDEAYEIFGTSMYNPNRAGSTVNGITTYNATIEVTGYMFHGEVLRGYLIFPDGVTMTGKTLTYYNTSATINTGFTISELQDYIDQGCVFIPLYGYYYSAFSDIGTEVCLGKAETSSSSGNCSVLDSSKNNKLSSSSVGLPKTWYYTWLLIRDAD